MRALITGVTGFVGRWLVEHLERNGDEVIGFPPDGSVTDWGLVRAVVAKTKPEVVYHLAARAHVEVSHRDPATVFDVNAGGTLRVLEAARQLVPTATCLVVSSSEVYGAAAPPSVEDDPPEPLTPYGASKLAAEAVALQVARSSSLRVVVARSFNHTGPGQSREYVVPALTEKLCRAVITGTPELVTGDLSPRRDFSDVRDVVRAYRLLATRGVSGRVYNVCSGTHRGVGEVFEDLRSSLARLTGVKGTGLLAKLQVRVSEGLLRPVEIPVSCGDPTRASAEVGYRPEIDWTQTVDDLVAYWWSRSDRT